MRRRWRTVLREPWIVLGPLVLVQWAALGAFVLVVRHNGWLFYQGGDETFFYTAARSLAGGHIPESEIGYAWSYLTSPVALAAGPSYLRALPVLVLVQAAVLVPVALYCVYGIAARIGGRLVGYVAAALWVALPFAAIPLWDHSYHAKYVEQFLPQAFGLTGLGDFPSMVCLLVAALFCLRALDADDLLEGVVAGLAAGFAIGIKPANALFLAGPLLAFAVARRLRQGLAFAVALLPALLALALWKYRGLGHLPVLSPAPRAVAAAALPASAVVFGRYLHVDWSRLRDNYVNLRQLYWGVPIWQSLPILGVAAARRALPKVLLLAGWLGAFLIFKGGSDRASLDGGTLLRLLLPAIPPLVVLCALVALFVPAIGRRQPATPSRPLDRRAVGAAAAVFALVPLLLFVALPPLRARTAVKYFDENVFVPVDRSFSVDVRRRGARAVLTWNAPAAPGIRVFYRIFRSRPVAPAPDPTLAPVRNGIRCLAGHAHGYVGAADCRLEMTFLGTTRARTIVDKPPRGPWVYRIGLAANWIDDTAGGDVLVLSAPAQLSARH